MRKLDEVLMMETRVVEEARVRAEVKRAHIKALKARFRRKKDCGAFQLVWGVAYIEKA